MAKVLTEPNIESLKAPKISKSNIKYTLTFVSSLCFLIVMGSFAFFNQPLYIRFRLMTPELTVAIVFFVLLIASTSLQVVQLLKIEKKIHWLDFSAIALSLISFFLNIIGVIAVILLIVAYVKNISTNSGKIKLTLFGFLGFLAAPIFAFATMLAWGTAGQLDKNETTSFTIKDKAQDELVNELATNPDKTFTVYSWNVGYASTGSEMDYFYDKSDAGKPGSMGKSQNKAQVLDHLKGITQFVDQITKKDNKGLVHSPLDVTRVDEDAESIMDTVKLPTADFGIFQEVDRNSIRSMDTNQPKILSSHLGNYRSEFSRNMKDSLLPAPFMDPGGQVEAGEFSFSHYKMSDAHRVSLKSAGTGIDGIFNLKRAIGLTEYALPNGGTLHMGDLHMSAFPEDHVKRDKEFNTLIAKLKEWTKSPKDRVIIGGDWNTDLTEQYYYKKAKDALVSSEDSTKAQALHPVFGQPFTNVKVLDSYDIAKYPQPYKDFIKKDSSWKLGIDKDLIHPSMRLAATKWTGFDDTNKNQDVAIIDGFLVSKGVQIVRTKTIQQGWHKNASNKEHPFLFADSDHNPIMMQFKLK